MLILKWIEPRVLLSIKIAVAGTTSSSRKVEVRVNIKVDRTSCIAVNSDSNRLDSLP